MIKAIHNNVVLQKKSKARAEGDLYAKYGR